MADLKRLSKLISVMLRHAPEDFGLTLDAQGFTDLDAVWAQVEKRHGKRYARADLQALLEDDSGGQQRFEVVDGRIRARYGHSSVDVRYEAVEPPELLYHGTYPDVLDAIRREGLKSMARQYVHLSVDTDRAADVAGRRGKPVILTIRAKAAYDAGLIFYHPEPKHYLVRDVPMTFINFPTDEA